MPTPDFVINKQPAEKLAYTLDFTDFITSPVPLANVTVTAKDAAGASSTGTVIDSSGVVVGTNKVTITVKAGADGDVHDVRVVVTGSDGLIAEADGKLVIEEQGIGA